MKLYKKDRASATLVTSIISIMFICLCAGFAIDTAKNAYLKSSFTSRAQQTTQIALKNIDARGSIKEVAVSKLVSTYQGLYDKDETNVYSGSCTSREVKDWDGVERTRAMPYIVVYLNTDRAIGTSNNLIYTSEAGAAPVLRKGTYNPATKYKVISADIHDASANFMLSMFGADCQDYHQKVSAISFGSSGDLS